MHSLTRRRLWIVGTMLGLTNCGFQPVYAPSENGEIAKAASSLAQIEVAPIYERSGQLLRQALRTQFEQGNAGTAKAYDLIISYAVNSDTIGTQPDSTASRLRVTGVATWSLVTRDIARQTLTRGISRSVDGLNQINLQYFAADLATEQVQRRLANAISDEIALRLALYFNGKRPAA